jgi:hypothetical protein
LFRTLEGVQQKSGVPLSKLRRLVLKELVDNGLDEGARVCIESLPGGGHRVEDNGRGVDPGDVAKLFSINRPMVSSKLLRLPTRGALGNGLRIVAGAVLASGGFLIVTTRNRKLTLRPERDGTTTVVKIETVRFPVGTRVEIGFGSAVPKDQHDLSWARAACHMAAAGDAKFYSGASSPWWYDVVQFHELLTACGATPVRELISRLDGCKGARAGTIVREAGLDRMLCRDIGADQARTLLSIARASTKPVRPERLGFIGPLPDFTADARVCGMAQFGSRLPAMVPFVVEAWASEVEEGRSTASLYINRTPAISDMELERYKREVRIYGCGVSHVLAEMPKDKEFNLVIGLIAPYVPITSDGKAPNLLPFLDQIVAAAGKALRKARRPGARGEKKSQKDIVLDHLDAAIAKVSGNGEFRFNERQVFYVLRPIVENETGDELKIGHFKAIITEYEGEHGEIPKMYREPRGSLYHPHRGETISIGTLMVETYERPVWTYNKVIYTEKEGFSEALKDVRWPERHDCMLTSTKGFTTRAIRDLVDKLAKHAEPVTVFCVHDADAAGTMIYETFQQETKARGARKIEIVNLGLEPWEALAMGLQLEDIEAGDKRRAVAAYVRERSGRDWDKWLQTHRIELNAMTTPAFIAWLDGKMAVHGSGKLVPPDDVLLSEWEMRLENLVRENVTARILREAGLEAQVAAAIAAIEKPDAADLANGVRQTFEDEPEAEWRAYIAANARGRLSLKSGAQLLSEFENRSAEDDSAPPAEAESAPAGEHDVIA